MSFVKLDLDFLGDFILRRKIMICLKSVYHPVKINLKYLLIIMLPF